MNKKRKELWKDFLEHLNQSDPYLKELIEKVIEATWYEAYECGRNDTLSYIEAIKKHKEMSE